MVHKRTKSLQIAFLCLCCVQFLGVVVATDEDSANTGAEFLHNVISNLHRPHLGQYKSPVNSAVADDRIDVEEYIPGDVPYNPRAEELKILSKRPQNLNDYLPQSPDQSANDQQQAVSPSFLHSALSQNELSDLQNSATSQDGTQQTSNSFPANLIQSLTADGVKPDGMIPGYYYYFVPLNKNHQNSLNSLNQNEQLQPMASNNINANPLDLQQLQALASMQDSQQQQQHHHLAKSPVEPLFVAMAGFVGVAVVFLSAMMFIPRIGPLLHTKAALKRAPEEIATITKLVAESIDGKDCSERIACEVGRAMRSMDVGQKPIRLMEIMLPPSVAKQLAQVRRSALKKEECHFITCKRTDGIIKLVAKLKNTNHSSNKLLKIT
ncbi:uncharacterized protein LOC126836496 [Adelges cooleyi]|uniref:uncharacterized protein LOC126836496 n=1 Tax=Adelges cooleyi TaxID=133065 RepID=UPI00217FF410|nr:uncharacterized protein LOC126836496 [Adelges cooleyi]